MVKTNRYGIRIVTTAREDMMRGVDQKAITYALYDRFAGGVTFMDLYQGLRYPRHFHDNIAALLAEGLIVREDCEQPNGQWAYEYRLAG